MTPAAPAAPFARHRRRWPWVVAAIALLPVAALALAALLIRPDRYKPRLEAAVLHATGRALAIHGHLLVSRSLWPTIEMTDISFANLPGGSRPDMAHVKRIAARLSLPALLRHRLEIDRLTLVGPDILFELVGDRPNWVFAPADGTAAPGRDAKGDAGGDARQNAGIGFDIRAARIGNGMVTWRLPGRAGVMGIRRLAMDHPDGGMPFDIDSELVYGDSHPFALNVSARPTGGLLDPWRARIDFSAYDATLSAGGTVAAAGTYDLDLDGRMPALERLNGLWPALHLPPLHGLVLSAHVANPDPRRAIPVAGPAKGNFESADLNAVLPGLQLGATTLSIAKPGAPLAASGGAEYGDLPFSYQGTVGLPAKADASLPVDVALRTDRADSRLSLRGRLGLRDGGFDGMDGAIEFDTRTLAAWRDRLPAAIPALEDLALKGRVEVPAGLARFSLRDATLSSRQVAASGDVSASRSGPEATARLRVARLDLDALLPGGGGGPGGGTGLPWSMLRGPRLDLEARIDSMTWRGHGWRDLTARVRLADGRLRPATLRMALPEGEAEIALDVEADQNPVPVALSAHAPGLPLSLMLREAGLPDRAEGAMRIDAELRGRGNTPRELASGLDGTLDATMRGGAINDAALAALAAPALKALGIAIPARGTTPILCVALRGRFANGVGRFDTIALHAGEGADALQLSGAGQVDLRDDTLALKLRPLARLSGARVSVPVLVEGKLGAAHARLDADGLDKLGLLVDAWFGGDHPRTCEEAGLAP